MVAVIVALAIVFAAHERAVAALTSRASRLAAAATTDAAACDAATVKALKVTLAASRGDARSLLAAGSEALLSLLPTALCVVVGSLSDAGAPSPDAAAVSWGGEWRSHARPRPDVRCALFAPAASPAAALAAAADGVGDADALLDSDAQPGGVAAFSDWAEAAACAAAAAAATSSSAGDGGGGGGAGARVRCLTATLSAGGRPSGFVALVLRGGATARGGGDSGGGGGGGGSLPSSPSPLAPPAPRELAAVVTSSPRASSTSAPVSRVGRASSTRALTPAVLETRALLSAALALHRLEAFIRDGLDRALEAGGVARQGSGGFGGGFGGCGGSDSSSHPSLSPSRGGGGGGGLFLSVRSSSLGGGGGGSSGYESSRAGGLFEESDSPRGVSPSPRSAFGGSGRASYFPYPPPAAASPSPSPAVLPLSSPRDASPTRSRVAGVGPSPAVAAELRSLDAGARADAAGLRRWGVDASALPSADLHRLLRSMFLSSGLLLRFDVKPASFASFTAEIEASYRENAFHHWCATLCTSSFMTDASLFVASGDTRGTCATRRGCSSRAAASSKRSWSTTWVFSRCSRVRWRTTSTTRVRQRKREALLLLRPYFF